MDTAPADSEFDDEVGDWEPGLLALSDGPINWLLLGPEAARAALIELDQWVTFIRTTYGLSPAIVPPLWHRHDELIWELAALHQHWTYCYSPDAPPSAPLSWHHDFATTRGRLREWVSACGTRIDRDRPTRHTIWPGEPTVAGGPEVAITDRERDFREFLDEDSLRRTHGRQANAF